MLFSNPFFTLYVVLIFTSMVWAMWMDGMPVPAEQQKYNGTQAMIIGFVQVFVVAGAVLWAASH